MAGGRHDLVGHRVVLGIDGRQGDLDRRVLECAHGRVAGDRGVVDDGVGGGGIAVVVDAVALLLEARPG